MAKVTKTKKKGSKGITLIRKSNDLIEARYKFDVWEMRFFLSVLAQIRREDDDFKVYRVWYKDIVKTFGLKTHQSYDMLREGAKKLMNKSFYVQYEDKGKPRETQYHILRKLDYSTQSKEGGREDQQEYIDLTIEQEMKPFLLQLQKSFTTYELRNVTKLGAYPMRFYELLKQYEVIGNRLLKFEELKRMFELEKEYPRFPNFFQKIIQPAVRDINKFTDLEITEVEKVKEGSKISSVRFYFRHKNQEELEILRGERPAVIQPSLFDDTPPQYSDPTKPQILLETEPDRLFSLFYSRVVENMGVTPLVFADLVKQYNEEQISQAVRVTNRAKINGMIKTNMSGYFVQALKQGYTDQKEEADKKKVKEDKAKKDNQRQDALRVLEDEKEMMLKDRIRELVSENPKLTEQAIVFLQNNTYTKPMIEVIAKNLKRALTIEDYRQEVQLRDWVIKTIVEQYKEAFADILADFEEKVARLGGSPF